MTDYSAPPAIAVELNPPNFSAVQFTDHGYLMLYGIGPDDKPHPIRVDKDGRVIINDNTPEQYGPYFSVDQIFCATITKGGRAISAKCPDGLRGKTK